MHILGTHVAVDVEQHVASVNNVASNVFTYMWSDLSSDMCLSVKAL